MDIVRIPSRVIITTTASATVTELGRDVLGTISDPAKPAQTDDLVLLPGKFLLENTHQKGANTTTSGCGKRQEIIPLFHNKFDDFTFFNQIPLNWIAI
ncbi:hypothetical protein FACS189413_11330 [Bacteroidia bacterium]|nr:hypothetical protein FACS189463_3110 [Bacteroidia bacterium]GHU70677.1 hypothetical protein FACS189413_11330 [Bacteroidia bacterium]